MSPTSSRQVTDRPLLVNEFGLELFRVRPLLDLDEPFQFHETGLDADSGHQFLGRLQNYGAIEIVGTDRPDYDTGRSHHSVNEYRWDPHSRESIRAYLDSLAVLPCGHPAHVYNPHGSAPDELGCRYCAAGDPPPEETGQTPPFEKATVKQALAAQEGR